MGPLLLSSGTVVQTQPMLKDTTLQKQAAGPFITPGRSSEARLIDRNAGYFHPRVEARAHIQEGHGTGVDSLSHADASSCGMFHICRLFTL